MSVDIALNARWFVAFGRRACLASGLLNGRTGGLASWSATVKLDGARFVRDVLRQFLLTTNDFEVSRLPSFQDTFPVLFGLIDAVKFECTDETQYANPITISPAAMSSRLRT